MNERRGMGFILTGLVLGAALGLVFAWFINPVQYSDIAPAILNDAGKDSYRALVALAYQGSGGLERARQRLELLKEQGQPPALVSQAQRLVASGDTGPEARALALLAAAINPQAAPPQASATPTISSGSPAPTTLPGAATLTLDQSLVIRTATPLPSATPTITLTITTTPTVTPTRQRTFTPQPSLRPSPTLGAPFAFKDKKTVCDSALPAGLLQVEVLDSAGKGVPGVRITVTWPGGEDSFYTGLMPDSGTGYADFVMTGGTIYSARAGEGGEPAINLTIPTCPAASGGSFPGAVKLRFTQ